MSSKIVFCGCSDAGLEVLNFLISKNFEISHIVSLNSEQATQYNVSGYASFDEIARKNNIPIYFPKTYSLKDKSDVDFFEKNNFELLLIGGWQRLIPEIILKKLKIGGIGFHGSSEFLPKGRGRSTVNWSLIRGKTQFILHAFLMTPGVDDGDIIAHEIFDINQWDTCKTINYKFSIIQKRILEEIIPKLLSNDFKHIPQTGEPSYYPKRTPDDGLIDWSKPVYEIYNFIRALTRPYPGAFTYVKAQRLNIWESQPFDSKIKYEDTNGRIVEKFSTGHFVVKCKDGLLLITDYDGKVAPRDILGEPYNDK